MKQLLGTDFIEHYAVSSNVCVEDYIAENCDAIKFDLDDGKGVVPEGLGKLSLENLNGVFDLLHYEGFIGECKRPRTFQEGRKRCDYVLWHTKQKETFLLCEITSALGGRDNLEKPIEMYYGGKLQKAEIQLAESLKTLLGVPSIKAYVDDYAKKVCLMAYRIYPYKEKALNDFVKPFQRFSLIEMLETGNNGAELDAPEINAMGFSFRRIAHGAVFSI